MIRKTIWHLAVVLVALWAFTGCSDSPSTPSTDDDLVNREQAVNLDDPYGGFNLADEAPNFGDELLVTDYGPDAIALYDDAMADDPEVRRIRERRNPHTYLMITWGNLDADTTIDFVTDWSGGLVVENGMALLARTIRFDANDEVLPRTARDTIEWVSYTQPHYDGILVSLYKIMRSDSGSADSTRLDTDVDAPLSVTFRTGPLTVTIDEENLRDLHRVVTVDDAGNAVAFNTITVAPFDCPVGFMAGQWRDVDDRPGGIFRGKWISESGVHMGYLRGVYGPNSRGEKVFFGKWITAAGRFSGLLRGHYESVVDRPGGTFQGEWVGRDLHRRGYMRGVYGRHVNDEGDPVGFFRGRWMPMCR